ncbi:MAG: hypothetical protein IIC01_03990 [Planctomycetes bacterium]|nr:hypothetical protein [Planctomycetota bacterium]
MTYRARRTLTPVDFMLRVVQSGSPGLLEVAVEGTQEWEDRHVYSRRGRRMEHSALWGNGFCSRRSAAGAGPGTRRSAKEPVYLMAFPTSASGMELAVRVTLTRLYDTDSSAGNAPCPARPPDKPDLSVFNGQVRWVGPPQSLPEGSGPDPNRFAGAALQDCPSFTDWPAAMAALGQGVLHVYGAEIVPCSQYEVELVEFGCAETSNEEACFSTPLTVRTGKWGDVTAPFYPSSGQPNFTDIGAVVAKFKGQLPPYKVETLLRGNVPPVTSAINFTDIGRVVDAFKSIPYPEAGPDGDEPIRNLVDALVNMESDLAPTLGAVSGQLQTGVPTLTPVGSLIDTSAPADLFEGGLIVASGQVDTTVDICAGTVDFVLPLTEGALTRTLTQHVSLNVDVVTLFGTLSFSDGSPTLNGGWLYDEINGALAHPDSDPTFHDEVAIMLHAQSATAGGQFGLGNILAGIGTITSMLINYVRDWFVPYTPPVTCDGPAIENAPGESCDGVNVPCEQELPETCSSVGDIPDVSIGFRKCMKGRCACGGSNFPQVSFRCDPASDCGVCGSGAWGCNLPGGSVASYCLDDPQFNTPCNCANIMFHEMSHGCGTNDRDDGSTYDAYRIGNWFGAQCIPHQGGE